MKQPTTTTTPKKPQPNPNIWLLLNAIREASQKAPFLLYTHIYGFKARVPRTMPYQPIPHYIYIIPAQTSLAAELLLVAVEEGLVQLPQTS